MWHYLQVISTAISSISIMVTRVVHNAQCKSTKMTEICTIQFMPEVVIHNKATRINLGKFLEERVTLHPSIILSSESRLNVNVGVLFICPTQWIRRLCILAEVGTFPATPFSKTCISLDTFGTNKMDFSAWNVAGLIGC